MGFNKAKCTVLHLGQGRMEGEGIDSTPAKKNLGILVPERLIMVCQRALATQKDNCILGKSCQRNGTSLL